MRLPASGWYPAVQLEEEQKGKFHIDLIIGKKYDDLLLGITCKIIQLNPIRVIYPNGRDTAVNPENLNDTINQLSEKLSNRYSAK